MHSDVSGTIYSESTMEPDNKYVFEPLSLALLSHFPNFFLSNAKKEHSLNPYKGLIDTLNW